jgi:hypothetical protein
VLIVSRIQIPTYVTVDIQGPLAGLAFFGEMSPLTSSVAVNFLRFEGEAGCGGGGVRILICSMFALNTSLCEFILVNVDVGHRGSNIPC